MPRCFTCVQVARIQSFRVWKTNVCTVYIISSTLPQCFQRSPSPTLFLPTYNSLVVTPLSTRTPSCLSPQSLGRYGFTTPPPHHLPTPLLISVTFKASLVELHLILILYGSWFSKNNESLAEVILDDSLRLAFMKREKSGLHPPTIAKVRFSIFNYETGQHRPSHCQNRAKIWPLGWFWRWFFILWELKIFNFTQKIYK